MNKGYLLGDNEKLRMTLRNEIKDLMGFDIGLDDIDKIALQNFLILLKSYSNTKINLEEKKFIFESLKLIKSFQNDFENRKIY